MEKPESLLQWALQHIKCKEIKKDGCCIKCPSCGKDLWIWDDCFVCDRYDEGCDGSGETIEELKSWLL